MKLFIANTSKQHHIFAYRMGKGRDVPVSYQTIPVGSQIQVGNSDLNKETVDFIINQHARYGMRSADDLAKNADYIGLVYSIDKQVPMGDKFIETAEDLNATALNRIASDQREQSAAAAGVLLENAVAGTKTSLAHAEIVVTQEGDAGVVSQGVEIVPEGKVPRNNPSRDRRAVGRRR
jgi:hypothetical protein